MNPFFPEIRHRFGFGFMRLPMCGDAVDLAATTEMVDAFLSRGFQYFDTARPYLHGQSETALRHCLTSRYPRQSYILANKLSYGCFTSESDILPLFESQLESCGVSYFDFYLMHALSAERYESYTACNAFALARQLKREGKIRHIAMSFHDSAEVLDRILTEHPEIEAVQLQFNYLDYDDPNVQSRKCYDVCRAHNRPVLVMEPVKGGSLASLPTEAHALLGSDPAGFALRFAASFEGVAMVLSGMSNLAQVLQNCATMHPFHPLSTLEMECAALVRTICQAENRIPCTACGYCVDGCPGEVPIPQVFAAVNSLHASKTLLPTTQESFISAARQCLHCGQCEDACPQHLQIRRLLERSVEVLGTANR